MVGDLGLAEAEFAEGACCPKLAAPKQTHKTAAAVNLLVKSVLRLR
jgi:hypothetical protein